MDIKTKTEQVVEQFSLVGVVPVVRLDKVENAEKLAKALRDGGINCAEVTFRAEGADEVISRMVKAYPDMFVGAGTVLTCEQADAAMAAGAKFCVAPGLNPAVVKHCLEAGMPFRPRAGRRKVITRRAGGRAGLYQVGLRPLHHHALHAHGRHYGRQPQQLPRL